MIRKRSTTTSTKDMTSLFFILLSSCSLSSSVYASISTTSIIGMRSTASTYLFYLWLFSSTSRNIGTPGRLGSTVLMVEGRSFLTRTGHIIHTDDDVEEQQFMEEQEQYRQLKSGGGEKKKESASGMARKTQEERLQQTNQDKPGHEKKYDAASDEKVEINSMGEEIVTGGVGKIRIKNLATWSTPTVNPTTIRATQQPQRQQQQQQIPTPNHNKIREQEGKPTIPAPPAASVNSMIRNENQHNNNSIVEQYMKQANTHTSNQLAEEIYQHSISIMDFLTNTRRTLHQYPELMYQEQQTSQYIQQILQQWHIPFTTGWAKNIHPTKFPGEGGYGIVADIGTGELPCILLRADMDALPIQEITPVPFQSVYKNKMHACGHDAHTTMLLGAVSILKSMEHSLPGTVRIMFQPAEEGGAGGKRMREEGVLEKHPKPQHAFGMHVWPTLPSGTIASRPGPLMAACERFEIVLEGIGGHAAMPHLTVDPIVTASAIVMNLQTIVSRTLNPLDAGVCSITKIQAGEAFNIIPQTALLRGTIRALQTDTLLALRSRVQHIVETTAAVHGCNASITYSPDFYPPTINDPVLYETFAKDVGALMSDEGFVREIEPTMGAEDFSFLAESIPSTFFFLGQGSGNDPPTNYGLHHPQFNLDESVMSRGVQLHVNLAIRALRKLQNT